MTLARSAQKHLIGFQKTTMTTTSLFTDATQPPFLFDIYLFNTVSFPCEGPSSSSPGAGRTARVACQRSFQTPRRPGTSRAWCDRGAREPCPLSAVQRYMMFSERFPAPAPRTPPFPRPFSVVGKPKVVSNQDRNENNQKQEVTLLGGSLV